MRSLLVLYRSDRLVDTSQALVIEVALPEKYAQPEQRVLFFEQLGDRLAANRHYLVIHDSANTAVASPVPEARVSTAVVKRRGVRRKARTAKRRLEGTTVMPRIRYRRRLHGPVRHPLFFLGRSGPLC
jgi:hypothetical protein